MVMCVFTRYTRFAISLRTKELMSVRRRSSCLCSLYLAFQPHSNHDTVLSNQAFELTFKRLKASAMARIETQQRTLGAEIT